MDSGASAHRQQRLPTALLSGSLGPHRGSDRALGALVAAPGPRPAGLGAGAFFFTRECCIWQHLAGLALCEPSPGENPKPDTHSLGVNLRTALFLQGIFLVSKNNLGCGNPRTAPCHSWGKTEGRAVGRQPCLLKGRFSKKENATDLAAPTRLQEQPGSCANRCI